MRSTWTSPKQPPVVKGPPLIGNLIPMTKDPLPFFVDSYRTYGPVFRIRVLQNSWVVMAGVDANNFLGRDGHRCLSTEPVNYGFLDAVGTKSSLVAIDGDRHAHLRRIQARPHSPEASERKLPALLRLAEEMVRALPVGPPIDLLRPAKMLVTRQLGTALVRKDPIEIFDDLDYLLRVIANVTQLKKWPPILLKMPRYRNARARVQAVARQAMWEHKEHPSPPGEEDLIDALVAARDEAGNPLAEEVYMAATFGGLAGGLETVASSFGFAVYAMLKHPAVLAEVEAEVERELGATPTLAMLERMPALYGVVLETLRVYPPIVTLLRQVIEPFEFGGYRIARGENLFLPTIVPHFLAEHFPEPERFDITRYRAPRNEHRAVKGAFAPYGRGVHQCLGASLAEVILMLSLATLVRDVRLELVPRDYTMTKVHLSPLRVPDRKFRVRVVERRTARAPVTA